MPIKVYTYSLEVAVCITDSTHTAFFFTTTTNFSTVLHTDKNFHSDVLRKIVAVSAVA